MLVLARPSSFHVTLSHPLPFSYIPPLLLPSLMYKPPAHLLTNFLLEENPVFS